MRRNDRLFEQIRILRDGALHTSTELAGRLGVSTRTIWRDMETLAASGVPVAGERGVGYRLTAPIALPPMTLTETELEALHLGLSVVAETADPELQAAAQALSGRIAAALPGQGAAPATGWGFATAPFAEASRGFRYMPAIRAAIRDRRKLRLTCAAPGEEPAERVARPLQMEYWGRLWTLTAWCELSGDFRVFRVDRIEALETLPDGFADEAGKRLADYIARYAEGPDGN